MRKKDEISDPNSCLNTAKTYDWIFVLIEKDIAAPATIRFWVQERIRLGKNQPNDDQLKSALRVATNMEIERGKKNG